MLFLPGPSPISVYLQHKRAGCVDVFSAFSEILCLAEMPLMIFFLLTCLGIRNGVQVEK